MFGFITMGFKNFQYEVEQSVQNWEKTFPGWRVLFHVFNTEAYTVPYSLPGVAFCITMQSVLTEGSMC